MKELVKRAKVLIEGLPYIREFSGKVMVIKYGGSAMKEERLKRRFCMDVVLMKYVGMKPVIVHGGGARINEILKKIGKQIEFFEGQRVTDRETLQIVQMVLAGLVNKEIVASINAEGGKAVGITGVDGAFLLAERQYMRKGEKVVDIGHVGRIKEVNPEIINSIDEGGFIPVIAPMGFDERGNFYNINADIAAGKVAAALCANKLIILTDTRGILRKEDNDASLIPTLFLHQIDELIEQGLVRGGMIPKVEACRMALNAGVEKAHIIDGRILHSLLLELFTDKGIGTQIIRG
jgi:acetylglutamate kinase